MPSRILLSTDAQVSEPFQILQSTKRRRVPNCSSSEVGSTLPQTFPATQGSIRDGGVLNEQTEFEAPAKRRKLARPAKYPCNRPDCNKAFTRPCNLEAHLRSHTGERPFVCTYALCGRAFFKKTHLTAHIKGVHDKEKKYVCTEVIHINCESSSIAAEGRECGASFTTNQHLKRHIETHAKKFPHICSAYPPCIAGFRKKTQLERHTRLEHLGLKPYQCKEMVIDADGVKQIQCPEAFDTKGKLAGHIQKDHIGGGGYKYFCEECTSNHEGGSPQIFNSGSLVYWPDIDSEDELSDPEPHPELSSDEDGEAETATLSTPHHFLPQNNTTNNIFITLSSLTTTTTATAAAAYSSTTRASLGFKTYAELRHHLKSYHPPICKFCSKHCQSHRDLRNHTYENHTAPVSTRRTFFCPNCTSSFTRKSALKTHIATVHEGKKGFKCPWEGCGSSFGHKSSMQKHYKRHVHPGRKTRQEQLEEGERTLEGVGLLTKLTGHGYEDLPNRALSCVIEGCQRRFGRVVDLKRHLAAKESGHGFSEQRVIEVMQTRGIERDDGSGDENEDEEYEDDEGGNVGDHLALNDPEINIAQTDDGQNLNTLIDPMLLLGSYLTFT